MKISLGSGAITSDSKHTFWMILFVQSFYFLALGLCLVMYDQQLQQQQQQNSNNDRGQQESASSSNTNSDVLSLDFLFTGGSFSRHPHHAVVLIFLLHGILLGGIVGNLVERRSWCLDVVFTAEVIFFISTLCVAGVRHGGLGWRLLCLAIDTVGAFIVAFYIAGKREQQEIVLSNNNNSTSATATENTSSNSKQ